MRDAKGRHLKRGESEFQMDERGEVKTSVNVAEFSNYENSCCLLMLLLAEVKVKAFIGLYGCVSYFFHHSCVCVCPLSGNI